MSHREDRQLLPWSYRVGWRVRYLGMHVFGPAQLGGGTDPHVRLDRERAARLAAARERAGRP